MPRPCVGPTSMALDTSRRSLLASLGAAGATASLGGCLGGPPVAGGDTPTVPEAVDGDWPMPAADAGRSSYAPDVAGPTDPPAELWQVPTDWTPTAPVVADATVFVGGDDGTVLALDARDGTERWRTTLVEPVAAAPSVLGDTVHVPTETAVVALARSDGSERWHTTAPAERDTLVADHGVYWVADATVAALDRSEGGERWRTDLADPWEPHLFASPDTVFVSSGVHGPRPWELAPETGEVTGKEPESGYDFAAERFYRDGVRYGLDPFFETVQTVPLDGTTGWSHGLPPQETAAVAGGGDSVYLVGAGTEQPGLFALADADGSERWHTGAVTSFRQRPVVTEDCVVVSDDGALVGVDPADGAELWTLSEAAGSEVAVAGDVVFAADGAGVRAFRPT
jgi:outer membrane protein assembly factor BamB